MNISFGPEHLKTARESLNIQRFPNAFFSELFLCKWLYLESKRVFDRHSIMASIGDVENRTRHSNTKKHSLFSSGPLKGIYKKHFSSACHIVKNIGLATGLDGDKTEKIEKIIKDVFREHSGSDIVYMQLAHRFSIEAYDQRVRAKSLTGDYIVFAKYNGSNYYLSIEPHNINSELVYSQITNLCLTEYPELQFHKTFRGQKAIK